MSKQAGTEVKGDSSAAALDTHQKALSINLDATSFGSFAEIGAGQEVARWFLRVGGASGTVGKTISAYDKEVSDDLYGSGTRYVSRQRVEAMVEREWASLLHQVGGARGKETRLFVFADTIAARNFAGTNDCHGWIGVRFQDRPGGEASEIVLHVNLRDAANLPQQEAVGVLGVNLLHGLMNERVAVGDLGARLFDGLEEGRIEVDQIVVKGGAFAACDAHALHAALARDGRAEAVTMGSDGVAVAANEFLYKKAVVIVPTAVAGERSDGLSRDAVDRCVAALQSEVATDAEVKGVIDVRLMVVEPGATLPGAGQGAALLTRHRELYRATGFVRRYTRAPVRFAVPLPALVRIFDEARHEHLDSRLLEGIARLFGSDVRVLAYPCPRETLHGCLLKSGPRHGWTVEGTGQFVTAEQLRPAPPLRHLYEYLLGSGFLVSMAAE